MYENNYLTHRNYENNNMLNMDNINDSDINLRSNTQNYFYDNNPDFVNENVYNYQNDNLNEINQNFFQINSNSNQYNNEVDIFKNRIDRLQKKVGKLNMYKNEIEQAINHNLDNNNLNKTQNYYDDYENNYINDNKLGLKYNKSFDMFRMNYNNYDFIFDSGNIEDYQNENNFNNNNYEEQEEAQLNNEDTNINNNMINQQNNELNMMYNDENKDNSFIGFYDNIFTNQNYNKEEIQQKKEKNSIEDNTQINSNNNKNDYKNIQLIQQNYQFKIPKTTNNNFIDGNNIKNINTKIDNNNNIQIVSNELAILTNESKKDTKDINNIRDIKEKTNINEDKNKNDKNDDLTNEKNNQTNYLDESRQKELKKYDLIIAQAKELNNQFLIEQKGIENKNEISNDNIKEKISDEKKGIENEKVPEKKEINQIQKNIFNEPKEEKKEKKEEKKEEKEEEKKIIIKKPNKYKHVSFVDEKIYIKYNQEDYILKLNVFNHKNERINFVTHDLKNYIQRLKRKESLESGMLNCPDIDYEKININMINLVKKENKVQTQNPRIINKANKSVKNPKIKIPVNKNEIQKDSKNVYKIDKIGKKPLNNIKIIKNNHNIKNEKITKVFTPNNLNKDKIVKKSKTDKLIKKRVDSKNKNEKDIIKNLDIFDNPIFKEGQKAINNLKKFFEENNLDDDNIEK